MTLEFEACSISYALLASVIKLLGLTFWDEQKWTLNYVRRNKSCYKTVYDKIHFDIRVSKFVTEVDSILAAMQSSGTEFCL